MIPPEHLGTCRSKCGGPCDARPRVDCRPKCGGFCLDAAAPPEVPLPVRKNWEVLYDQVMKEGDVGCQPYFAPPDPMVAKKITTRMYRKQTIYQDRVQNALKRQIGARKEDDDFKESEDDFVDTSKALNQVDIDLIRILNAPPIDVAYRNWMARSKESQEEEEKEKDAQAVNIPVPLKEDKHRKKALMDPADKKKDFVLLAKMTTTYDEELTLDVEQLWAALGPVMIELDFKEKKKSLRRIFKALKESKSVQQLERNRMQQQNKTDVEEYLEAKSTELDKKYNRVLTLLKQSMEKAKNNAVEILLKSCEELNNYEIEWAKMESTEKFQESIKVFTQYCNLWMKIMESIDAKTELNARQLREKDHKLILDVQKLEEERILKVLGKLNKDHELIESTLADYLYARDQTISQLLLLIEELQKKVDIWKNLVSDLMKQFQKFVTFAMGEQSMLTQYLLSMDAMYNHFLNDSLQKDREKKAKEADKDTETLIRKRYPACALPQRLSRGSTITSRTTTSETEPEVLPAEVPEAIMAGITTGEFPEYVDSYDELENLLEKEVEAVVETFGNEETNDNENTVLEKALTKQSSRSEVYEKMIANGGLKDSLNEECANMDESTRNKIDTVINLMHEKKELMKGFMSLW